MNAYPLLVYPNRLLRDRQGEGLVDIYAQAVGGSNGEGVGARGGAGGRS